MANGVGEIVSKDRKVQHDGLDGDWMVRRREGYSVGRRASEGTAGAIREYQRRRRRAGRRWAAQEVSLLCRMLRDLEADYIWMASYSRFPGLELRKARALRARRERLDGMIEGWGGGR